MAELWKSIREGVSGNVEPQETVTLSTKLVRGVLGVYLVETVAIALWWSINDHVFFPWVLSFSALLQVGWFWNKVTDSWKDDYFPLRTDSPTLATQDFTNPPTINVTTDFTLQQPTETQDHPLADEE